ncbi:uncharacterized protein [Dysidea avara]|uniref:uncharacterized protein n=1 Tax=Dysidea avara TaxID=196820 RepID=UPI00331AAA79
MAAGRSTIRAGYDANFERIFVRKNPEPLRELEVEQYRCFICRLLLRQPPQLSCCGRRSCRVCIEAIRNRHGKVFRCPQCNEEIGDGTDKTKKTKRPAVTVGGDEQ